MADVEAVGVGLVLLEVVKQLPSMPDVLLVNATGRDHPGMPSSQCTSALFSTCLRSA